MREGWAAPLWAAAGVVNIDEVPRVEVRAWSKGGYPANRRRGTYRRNTTWIERDSFKFIDCIILQRSHISLGLLQLPRLLVSAVCTEHQVV